MDTLERLNILTMVKMKNTLITILAIIPILLGGQTQTVCIEYEPIHDTVWVYQTIYDTIYLPCEENSVSDYTTYTYNSDNFSNPERGYNDLGITL